MDVALTFNGRDFHERLSTYKVSKETVPSPVVTTLDYGEHYAPPRYRDVITFRLFPLTDEQATEDFNALSVGTATAIYTDPTSNENDAKTVTKSVRVMTNLDSVFGLRSADGNRYYKGGDIVLRAVMPG